MIHKAPNQVPSMIPSTHIPIYPDTQYPGTPDSTAHSSQQPRQLLVNCSRVCSAVHTTSTYRLAIMSEASAAVGLPPLSGTTLAEFESNTKGDIWNELLVLARQPGVVNLGQGFPDYDGCKAAREAAADAMVDPSKVS